MLCTSKKEIENIKEIDLALGNEEKSRYSKILQ